jgi:hypothetical protein
MGDDSHQYGFESKVELTTWLTSPSAEPPTECQFVGSLIQFFEQADVLDRDDGLVGEGSSSLIWAGVKGAPRCDVRSTLQ